MTIKELREAIKDLPDEAQVEVTVSTYTKAFPVHYATPQYVQPHYRSQYAHESETYQGSLRIPIHLPEGMSVHTRKAAA